MSSRGPPEPAADAGLDSIERAIADIAAGKAVVVVDDEDRENEGDLVFAARDGHPRAGRVHDPHTVGLLCVPLTEDDLDRLELPPDGARTTRSGCRPPTRSRVDAREGVTHRHLAPPTGRTRSSCSPTRRHALRPARPGHVFPLRALRRRRAAPPRPHRGCRRPGPARRAQAGRGHLRDRRRRTARHGAARRAARVRRRARPGADLHRRPDRLPPAHREPGRAGRRGQDPHRARRVHAPSATSRCSTASTTSRWSAATSATARTCWSACTPSA